MLNFHGKKILLLVSYAAPYTAGGGINAFNFGKFLILKLLSLIFILPFYFYFIFKANIIIIYGGNIIAWELAILFGKLLNKKVVFRSTMFDEDDSISLTKNKISGLFRKPLLKKIDLYFSLHPGFTRSYKSLFPDSNNILETVQGVNPDIFKPLKNEKEKKLLRNKLKLPANKYLILSVGLLVKRKGYLKIFNALSQLDIPFKYVILGEYNLEKTHHLYNKHKEITEIYENGKKILKDKITFRGYQTNIMDYYKAADLFLMNSYQEGVPNSLLEAMACGLPPVCNNLTGLEDYLTYNYHNCLLFSKSNEIPSLIEKLYSNHTLSARLSKNALVTIVQNFSFEKVYKNLKKCLNF